VTYVGILNLFSLSVRGLNKRPRKPKGQSIFIIGQSRDTDNIGNTRHRTKKNKTQHRKPCKKMSNTDNTKRGELRKQVLAKGKQQTTPNGENPENRCL
jgi:hypothetical protein